MTAEIAEVSLNVDDVIEEVKAGEAVEIVVRSEAVAEVAPMPKYHFLREDGTIDDQTRAYERIDELVREGKLKHGFSPFPEDFFTRPLAKIPGLLEEFLAERHNDDDLR
jgi:antitoxin (DNA-binding transcriptional repressor) of toxin-antitoxin stability system